MTSPGDRSERCALTLTNVTKRFGSVTAVDDVSLCVRPGSVHALLGENGAGKTTLMRMAFGMIAPDSGAVIMDDGRAIIRRTTDAIDAGMGMVHQHFTNVASMTVAENVALGRDGRFDRAAARRRVDELSVRTGLALDPDARAEHLPVGAQQRLEILKALSGRATVLILDEPTAVLAPGEAEELLRWLRRFADEGNSVVLITHKLREALSVADRVTVLRRGRVVLDAPAAEATELSLARAMIGDELAPAQSSHARERTGPIIASVTRVSVVNEHGVAALHDVSLEIAAGEIVGIAAVEGAGQRELLRMLAGRLTPARGEVRRPDTVGFVPEDRHRDALVLAFDSAENTALRGLGARRGRMHWGQIRARAAELLGAFDVRGSADAPVASLSGGNQQKLIFARELDGDPELLVVENPTRGLDIRATRDVHERLRQTAARGTGVVVYSSDLDEVLALATRVIVMHAGRVSSAPIDRDAIGRAMLGVA